MHEIAFRFRGSGQAARVFWSLVVLVLKMLVVVWALQLAVFALGISVLMKRRCRPEDRDRDVPERHRPLRTTRDLRERA